MRITKLQKVYPNFTNNAKHRDYCLNTLDLLVLLTILVIGLIHLKFPLGGDQCIFLLGAKKIDNGGILYKDFWDTKQPGIFLFFYMAGNIFGFQEFGVHIFELIYWILFSILLIMLTRHLRVFEKGFFSSLLPLFVVGVYYCNATPWHLTQIEALINFFLFLFVWLAAEHRESGKISIFISFLSGIVVAAIICFKLVYLVIVFSISVLLIRKLLKHGQKLKDVLIFTITPMIMGTMIPVTLLIFHYHKHNALALAFDTFFLFPLKMISYSSEMQYKSLLRSIRWFSTTNSTLMVFGLLGFLSILKSKTSLSSIFPPSIVVWFTGGFFTLLIQINAWWEYHFQLFYAPVGILAAKGVDFFWKEIQRTINLSSRLVRNIVLIIFLILIFLNQITILSNKIYKFINKKDINLSAIEIREDTSFLRDSASLSGKIFVCGNPRYYLEANRDQATRFHGWALEYFVPKQWYELICQLDKNRPSYIFVDNYYDKLIKQKYPKFFDFIEREYNLFKISARGKWYVLNFVGPPK